MPLPPKSKAKSTPARKPGAPKKRPQPQRQPPAAGAPQQAPSGAPIEQEMMPPAEPAPMPGAFGSLPSMSALPPEALAAQPPPLDPMAPVAPPMPPGAAAALASAQSGVIAAGAAPKNQDRPEIPASTTAQIEDWWQQSDNLSQRANALWEFREANKTLFPARFDPTDPMRGRVPIEVSTGRDKRRVRIGRIYRDSLQTTALTVPDDIDFRWSPTPQAAQPEQVTGIPQSTSTDPVTPVFGKTLSIVQRALLDEAGLVRKFQAWVQDASVYPMAVLKLCFRREFSTTYINSTPPDKDTTDAAARLEALVQAFALKEFTDKDARFAEMLDLVKSMQQKARLSRWFGFELNNVPLDAFGISEDVKDLVDVYDASFMFEDTLVTGEQLLTRFPYHPEPDEQGNTFGIRADELTNCTPWDAENTSTDPAAKGTTRGRSATTPKNSGLSAMTKTKSGDPKKMKFLVRTLFSKKNRTVYTMLKGGKNYLEVYIPQKTSERWYPFAITAPNRVPTEIYGISDLELKREIQARINRKRSDEEKARWLSLDRLIYNSQAIDGKEVVKLSDIEPGTARGLNLGSPSAKIADSIMTFAYQFKPEAFDTSRDERDMDMMGALPVQALGQTGVANYAAEVETAVQGAAAAVKQRQGIIRRDIEGLLQASAEILLQELTPDEARAIAGPFAFWPTLYDEVEAQQIVEQARQAAVMQVAPQVMATVAQAAMGGQILDVKAIQAQLDQAAAPLWEASLVNTYGTVEPVTRETVYRRLKVQVKSTLLSTLDRQSRIQSMTLLAAALEQMTTAAMASGVPFNPRSLLKKAAQLLDDTEDFDEMFPAVSPLDVAAATAPGAEGEEGGEGDEEGGGGNPAAQGAQAKQGTSAEKSRGGREGGGRPDPASAAAAAA